MRPEQQKQLDERYEIMTVVKHVIKFLQASYDPWVEVFA